jgi:hypothetical protein
MCLTEAKKKSQRETQEKCIKVEKLCRNIYFCSVVFNIEQLKFHEKSGIYTHYGRMLKREKRNECVFLLLLSNLYKKIYSVRKEEKIMMA